MASRLWILLVALLLLAAPGGATAELDEGAPVAGWCDEAVVCEAVSALAPLPGQPVRAVRREQAALPAPDLGQIFRPPERA